MRGGIEYVNDKHLSESEGLSKRRLCNGKSWIKSTGANFIHCNEYCVYDAGMLDILALIA